jgi:hypothetical protein
MYDVQCKAFAIITFGIFNFSLILNAAAVLYFNIQTPQPVWIFELARYAHCVHLVRYIHRGHHVHCVHRVRYVHCVHRVHWVKTQCYKVGRGDATCMRV